MPFRKFASVSVLGLVLAVVLWSSPGQAQFVPVWEAGMDDNAWPLNLLGGGPNAAFTQENGSSNPAPGSPNNNNTAQNGDDDYYFAGTYPDPIGVVSVHETGFERAFVPSDQDLRIHFNLPADLDPEDTFIFTTDPMNLDQRAEIPDPRYQLEVFFNGTTILGPITIFPDDLNIPITSAAFIAEDVGAVGGPGAENVIHLRGTNLPDGGSWLGFDFHRLEAAPGGLGGDVNGDGTVDIMDFEIIRDNFLTTGATKSQGDLNFDGVVNYKDFRLWKGSFEGGGGAAVPEPSGVIMSVLFGLLMLFSFARRDSGKLRAAP